MVPTKGTYPTIESLTTKCTSNLLQYYFLPNKRYILKDTGVKRLTQETNGKLNEEMRGALVL